MTGAEVIRAARAAMRGPIRRASSDCLYDVAAIVLALTGRDILAAWRPIYATEAEAVSLADSRGGLLAASDTHFRAAGGVLTASPAVGDVGLLRAPSALAGATYGVCIGKAWITRGENGPAIIAGDVLGAWSWA